MKVYSLGFGEGVDRLVPLVMLLLMAISSFVMVEPSPFDLFAVLGFVGFLALGLRVPSGSYRVLFYVGLFILGNIISFSDVVNFTNAFRYMAISMYLFIIFVLFACMVYQDPEKVMPMFWRGYVIGALIAAVVGTLAFFGLIPNADEYLKFDRAKGMFKDPNVYGPYLVAPLMYLGLRSAAGSGVRRVFAILFFLVLLLGFLVSFSRGAIGNLVVALLLYMSIKLALTRSLRLFVRYALIVFSALAIGFVLLMGAATTERVGGLLDERAKLVQDYDQEAGGRFDTQKKNLIHGLGDPLGLGPGEEVLEFGIEPHNVYLYVLAENGWIGFVGFTAFVLAGIRLGIQFIRTAGAAVGDEYLIIFVVVVSTAVQSLLIDSLHWRHLFFLNGVLWGLTLNYRRVMDLGAQWRIEERTMPQPSAAVEVPSFRH